MEHAYFNEIRDTMRAAVAPGGGGMGGGMGGMGAMGGMGGGMGVMR